MVPLIDLRWLLVPYKDDHWGCCVHEVFVLNSMSHSLLCQLYPWTPMRLLSRGHELGDVGHWVAPARNPLHTAPASLAQLTAALKLSWMPCLKEKPIRNVLLQAGYCPIPISRLFFSSVTVLIKSTEGLAFLRDPTDTILLHPQHCSCCLCLLL